MDHRTWLTLPGHIRTRDHYRHAKCVSVQLSSNFLFSILERHQMECSNWNVRTYIYRWIEESRYRKEKNCSSFIYIYVYTRPVYTHIIILLYKWSQAYDNIYRAPVQGFSGPREFQPTVLSNIILYAPWPLSIGKFK